MSATIKRLAAWDLSTGSGVASYRIYRDGLYLAQTPTTQFRDETVARFHFAFWTVENRYCGCLTARSLTALQKFVRNIDSDRAG